MLKTSLSLEECLGHKHSVWTWRAWMEIVGNSCGLCSNLWPAPVSSRLQNRSQKKSSMSEYGKVPRLKESKDVFTSKAKWNRIAEKSVGWKSP